MRLWILLALLATGCSRVSVFVDVAPDGSWTREDAFSGKKPGGMGKGVPLEEVFQLPAGEGWETSREEKESEVVYTARRRLAAGASLSDLVVRQEKGARIVNEATVRRLDGGRIEYREVLRWEGERPPEDVIEGGSLEEVRRALPEALATEENARAVLEAAQHRIAADLFDPRDPFLGQLLTHPGLAERRLRRRVPVVVEEVLRQTFGDRLPDEERARTVARFAETLDLPKSTRPDPAGGPEKQAELEAMVPLGFYVVLPGKVVETNGRIDEVTGDVFWELYSQAVGFHGEVTLYAICEVGD